MFSTSPPGKRSINLGLVATLLFSLYPQQSACVAPPSGNEQPLVGSTVNLDCECLIGTLLPFLSADPDCLKMDPSLAFKTQTRGSLISVVSATPKPQWGICDGGHLFCLQLNILEGASWSHPQFGDACIATTQTSEVNGASEDCLFGNIYIPTNTTKSSNLPVLVYFHGGSARTIPPELIIQSSQKPLIFVTFQYRLGQFGFLGGSDVKANGALNAGFMDQRAALRWVQRYIHEFGGDRQKVTIWGQSAGAGATMFHLVAKGGDNEDLFRAAMGNSPSLSYMPAYKSSYVENIYAKFVSLTACAGQTGAKALRCLRAAPVLDIIRAGSGVLTEYPATLYVFAPILDGTVLSTRPVDAFYPRSSSTTPKFSRVPVLFGSNLDEGAVWSSLLPDPLANTSMPNANEDTVVRFLQGQWATMPRVIFDDAMNLSMGMYPITDYGGSVSLQGQQMYGEARYICTAGLITGGASIAGVKDSYQYSYHNPHLGSGHSAEIIGFFAPPADADAKDLALYQTMREYWTSFVTDGRPTSTNTITWEPSNSANGSPRLLLHPDAVAMEQVDETSRGRCGYWHRTWPRMHDSNAS
ncbi:hypothetical protein NLJ89_g3547 [Agrocybe chaxingu]|uniref:Carboxylic ester hydrolase n=1 Tax=Agrocybe chaxingu TaxID=84603 RepID=A0A9W8MVE0_9AGAR|nr:hypothetical protein NLJ89_g3547 [Agrocybe chaxingu]